MKIFCKQEKYNFFCVHEKRHKKHCMSTVFHILVGMRINGAEFAKKKHKNERKKNKKNVAHECKMKELNKDQKRDYD